MLAQDHQKGFAELNARRLRADLTFLTSEPLKGRLSLERGSEVAIHWIVSEFTKAGLQPAANGSYLQPVPLIEFRSDREKSGVTISRNGVKKTYRAPEAAGSFPKNARIRGGVVFAGVGVSAPELGYDDYAGLDVKGKVVLVFDHEPQEDNAASVFSGKGNTRYAGTYVKLKNAQQHGATAVLLMPEPKRKHPSNEERQARIPGSAQRRSRLPQQALADGEIQVPLVSLSEALGKELVALTGQTAGEIHEGIDRDLKPRSKVLPGVEIDIEIVNAEMKRAESYNVVGLRLSKKWDMEPALNVFFRSDQYPFVLKDIPAMWWFTGFHPDYHQVTDTVEQINFGKMEKILRLAYWSGLKFANTSTPPRFVSASK